MYYNNLAPYLKDKYGCTVFKICIDGGFTCPNRDGTAGSGGCIFCGERGSGEHIKRLSVEEQIKRYFSRERKAGKFIAYFQNFTNTYAPVDVLKRKYDSALEDGRVAVLSVGTRPDCITEREAELLCSYKERADVWVELGLQTSNDKTAKLINRGYETERFFKAAQLLKKYDLPIIAHVMSGLPGEGMRETEETVEFLNGVDLFGLKIHCVYVISGTELAEMFYRGEYTPLSMEEYAESVVYILTHISDKVIIHKITGDAPKSRLVAPDWNTDKNGILDAINGKMKEGNYRQGCLYKK